jgi:hypothetical protein
MACGPHAEKNWVGQGILSAAIEREWIRSNPPKLKGPTKQTDHLCPQI